MWQGGLIFSGFQTCGYEALASEAEAKQKLQLNHEAEAETEAQALL